MTTDAWRAMAVPGPKLHPSGPHRGARVGEAPEGTVGEGEAVAVG